MVGVFILFLLQKNYFKFSNDHKKLLFVESEMPTLERRSRLVCKVCRCGPPVLPHAVRLRSRLCFTQVPGNPLLGVGSREPRSASISCTVFLSNALSSCALWITFLSLFPVNKNDLLDSIIAKGVRL